MKINADLTKNPNSRESSALVCLSPHLYRHEKNRGARARAVEIEIEKKSKTKNNNNNNDNNNNNSFEKFNYFTI